MQSLRDQCCVIARVYIILLPTDEGCWGIIYEGQLQTAFVIQDLIIHTAHHHIFSMQEACVQMYIHANLIVALMFNGHGI